MDPTKAMFGMALEQFMDQEWQTAEHVYVAETRRVMKRWAPYLGPPPKGYKWDPIPTEHWPVMAHLLENQSHASRPRSAWEATKTTDIAVPVRISLPIIRAVFAALIMNRIASVRPMPLSSAGTVNVFYKNTLREDAEDENVTTADSDYAVSAENQVPQRLKIEITQTTIVAEKKQLMATWSSEAEEDLMGGHGLSIERELVQDMAQEIAREIEEIVVNEMFDQATAGGGTWNWTQPGTDTYAVTDYYQTLFHAILQVNRFLYDGIHRQGDYLLCGSRVAMYIDMAKRWTSTPSATRSPADMISGVQLMGRIAGRWDVFVTPYLDTDTALMGVYPRSMIDTGYIWAPYIPLASMPKIYAEAASRTDATMPGALTYTDKWTTSVRTRNGKRMVQPDRFATLTISA